MHFLAASFATHQDAQHLRDKITSRLKAALCGVSTTGNVTCLVNNSEMLLAFDGDGGSRVVQESGGAGCTPCWSVYGTSPWRRYSIADLYHIMLETQSLSALSIAPPFSAAFAMPDNSAVVTTDSFGLQHVYVFGCPGVALASSSSLVLGQVMQLPIDWPAVCVWMRVGHLLPGASLFVGVEKLEAGCHCRLKGGVIHMECERYCGPCASPGEVGAEVLSGAQLLRQHVIGCAQLFPDAVFELSGGIDSRLLLSALPRDLRRGRVALTIGPAEAPDGVIASGIAQGSGMRHIVVPLDLSGDAQRDDLPQQLRRVALDLQFAGDPVFTFLLERVREAVGNVPRFTGQGGEIARGFYYKYLARMGLQTTDRRRGEWLARWRIIDPDVLDARWVTSDFDRRSYRIAVERVGNFLAGLPGDWRVRTDSFYKRARMECGVGGAVSRAAWNRAVLAPFFSRSFVDWAASVTHARNVDSYHCCRMICLLDEQLGMVELDSGVAPREMVAGGWRRGMRLFARGAKLVERLSQRLRGISRPALGTRQLSERLCADPDVRRLFPHLVAAAILEPFGAKRASCTMDAGTLATLLRLEGFLEFCAPFTAIRPPTL